MNEISKFYKDLLESLGLIVDDKGLIYVQAHGIKKPLDIKGVPLYLPTDENVNTTVELVNGTPTPVKVLFNPLEEDVMKGTNEGFTKLKNIIELKMLSVIGNIGISMLSIMTEDNSKMDDMELIKFVNVLSKNKTSNRKQLVDNKTVALWVNLYEKIISRQDHRYVKIYIKKGGVIDGVKYNRVGTITYPFMEKFEEAIGRKEKKFLDHKLRKADIDTIEALFNYMFVTLEPKDVNQFGSLNKKSPSLHTLLIAYDSLYKRLRPIIDSIIANGVESDIEESLTLNPLPVKIEALGGYIDDLESEVRRVPKESIVDKRPAVVERVNPLEEKPAPKSGSFWDRATQNTLPKDEPLLQRRAPEPPRRLEPVHREPPRTEPPREPLFPNSHRNPVAPARDPYARRSIPIADDPWEEKRPARGGYGRSYDRAPW